MHFFTVNSKEVSPLLTYITSELMSYNSHKRHISWIGFDGSGHRLLQSIVIPHDWEKLRKITKII
jgi:hypothetical protein